MAALLRLAGSGSGGGVFRIGDGAAGKPFPLRWGRMIDLAAYLERIGFNGAATLGAVHRAHATSIPFENLDPWSGRAVSLDLVDVERKLVREGQGGYCFEHNLLLQAGLQQLGFGVDLLLARARTGGVAGSSPASHPSRAAGMG